jgi:hypothetical protein
MVNHTRGPATGDTKGCRSCGGATYVGGDGFAGGAASGGGGHAGASGAGGGAAGGAGVAGGGVAAVGGGTAGAAAGGAGVGGGGGAGVAGGAGLAGGTGSTNAWADARETQTTCATAAIATQIPTRPTRPALMIAKLPQPPARGKRAPSCQLRAGVASRYTSGVTAGAPRPSPLVELTLMRLREVTREPGVLFWAFGFPNLMAIVLGLAFRAKAPEPAAVGVLPGVPAEVTRALAAGGLEPRAIDEAAARAGLRAGRLDVVVAPAPGPTGDRRVAYRFDPARLPARTGRAEVDDILQRAAGRRDARPVRDQPVRERGARYIDFLIPGIIGMTLMMGSMWGVGWALVSMRVRRLLKRLQAAPMRRRDLLLAYGIARLLVISVELVVILALARLLFDVRVTGSWPALLLTSLGGAASFAGIAILTASRAQNNETMSGLMNLVMMPMFIVSGVFFSASHFPAALQPVIALLPLTALCDGLRSVMLDGGGLAAVAKPLAVLTAWGAACFALGLRIFRWS